MPYILLLFVFYTFALHFMLIALSTVAIVNMFTFHSKKKKKCSFCDRHTYLWDRLP